MDRNGSAGGKVERRAASTGSVPSSESKARRQLRRDFVEYSTLHGINDFVRAERLPIKLFWGLIFSFGLAMAFYGCYAIIFEYLRSPVVVSYVIQGATNMSLPDIVICPLNRFNRSYIAETNISEPLAHVLEFMFPMPFLLPFQEKFFGTKVWPTLFDNTGFRSELHEELEELLVRRGMNFSEFLDAAIPHCSSLFPPQRKGKVMLDCTEFKTVMTSAGRCYRIESTQAQYAPGIGPDSKLILHLPQEDVYNPGFNNWPDEGILFKLTEPGKGLDTDMTFVPKGVHAIVPLKATRYEFINDPPRYICSEEAPEEYSKVTCFDDCRIGPVEDECGCSTPATAASRLPICSIQQFFTCLLPKMSERVEDRNVSTACRLQCPPTCKYWKFQHSMSTAPIPAAHMRRFCDDDAEWEQLKNTIAFEVFFEDLEFTLIKHYPSMTGDSFVAQLGGQVSLWVGGSILTLVQLLIFLLELACPKYVRKSRTSEALAAALNGVVPGVEAKAAQPNGHCASPQGPRANGRAVPPSNGHDLSQRQPLVPRHKEALV